MEWITLLLLGLGLAFLISRKGAGMGCCGGGGSEDRHCGGNEPEQSRGKSRSEPEDNVIDLQEDEYTVIAPTDEKTLLKGTESGERQ